MPALPMQWGRHGRQGEVGDAAPPRRALCPDPPAMSFYDAAGDHEPQPRPLEAPPLRLPERLEETRQVFRRDPGPSIRDGEVNRSLLRFHTHLDRPPFRR